MITVTYRGVDPQGNGRAGQLEVLTARGFVEAAFAAGWRELEVRTRPRAEPVAGIKPGPGGRHRWWLT